MSEYHPQAIERKWQARWEADRAFEVVADSARPSFYCLVMFAYPSGHAHVGHVRNYIIGDVVARVKRARGFNVLHPFGWDAFGLPAENAAIKHGIPPDRSTFDNIAHMKGQLQRLGISYAWERELATCTPDYYVWNQWLFLKMLERDLAYRRRSSVNWCSDCQTVLANEQVVDGGCWRCGTLVEIRELDQWFLRITRYAQELLDGTDGLGGWPEKVLTMQRNWIGRSVGTQLRFPLAQPIGDWTDVEVFTTRVDTIFGATFVLLAPEHPMVEALIAADPSPERFRARVDAFRRQDRKARLSGELEKEGFDTGRQAVNPFTGETVPIWIANFILVEYGTGAVMAVPGHDQRDFEFARKHDLPVRVVIQPAAAAPLVADRMETAYAGEGQIVDSGEFTGLSTEEALERMSEAAETRGLGARTVQFRLKDWGISRQRYWGTPIPVMYCDACGMVPVPYEDLPVELPRVTEFTGKGESPLAQVDAFVNTTCPSCGGPARRETDTMDTFVDSSWYYYRYCDPKNGETPFSRAAVDYWTPVDFYSGGIEHAILHLLYSRFFCRVFRDLDMVSHDEPFARLLTLGMVLKDGAVMSKSKGNVVDPDDMIVKVGADALRLYVMFVAPPEKEIEWTDSGLEGSARFLHRVWRLVDRLADLVTADGLPALDRLQCDGPERALRRKTHETIQRVTLDLDPRVHLNTAVSGLMELVNEVYLFCDQAGITIGRTRGSDTESPAVGRHETAAVLAEAVDALVRMIAPFTPHMAEELWERLGHADGIVAAGWPEFDAAAAEPDRVVVPVQVNGKLRARLTVPADADAETLRRLALAEPQVAAHIAGRAIKKVLVPRGRLVNIVASDSGH